ncbi:peptidoglycan DD-metalloendopeptidase family protein [Arthrobacter sp. B2I5]|uniref:peptidoglycan DD-metalloendopeptidase family protein n=1 Tax=Arthrobacter sp. B2I5 TaxID=3042266 RepID=UPI0027D87865|nr:peptidoglycan DD-metalloendopeptidase family protein [Arthrobacter sp. B2I5]
MGFPPLRPCGPMGHTVETTCGRPRRGVIQLGKNSVPGYRKPDQRSFPPVARAVAAAGVLAASVCAVNLSAGSAERVQLAGAVAGTGAQGAAVPGGTSAGDALREARREAAQPASDQVGAGAVPPAILSNPLVTLAFPHTSMGGAVQGADGALTVGPAGMGRPGAGFLMAPLQLLNPSSPFGFRVSPISGTAGDFHLGQDYAAACGTPVHAADAGVVRAAGWHPWGGGNRVEVDHGDGLITTYNHLESIGVSLGDTVQTGQVIARVGTTGWSTGCHLHFEAILDGRYINPLRWSFLQLRDVNWALPAGMVSYAPGQTPAGGRITWTIPLKVDTGDGFPAAGLLAPPFPPRLPLAPAPAPSEATGVVLPPPDVQLTTTAPPSAESSGSAASPPPTDPAQSPTPSDPTPTPTDTATPAPSGSGTATPSPTDADTVTPSPSGSGTAAPSPTDSGTATPTPTDPSPTPTPSPTDSGTATPSPNDPDSGTPPPTGPAPTQTEPEPAPASSEPLSPPTEPLPSAPVATTPAPPPATVEPAPVPTVVEPAPAPAPTTPAPPPVVEPAPTPTLPPAEPEPTATATPTAAASTPPA